MVMMDLKDKEWLCYEEELNETKKSCTHCKTTKTPLWRAGPAGPKTLCNACGIRYRKKRDSMVGMNKGHERKREKSERKFDVGVNKDLNKSLKMKLNALGKEVLLHQSNSIVKKQRKNRLGEEEQAAFCLMALSCGFVFA
ncbi:PREDICTED: GATA transcription factor 15-like [Lupinus angustifolius]|uniref:GATA transcription factor 15-like n=1 Tax=Lupinus angustifolius TaxID=3871 RepID=UPI00092E4735|nr:PREDICTED: GATA transcription factor 15-like [Lupinus angustifolius]